MRVTAVLVPTVSEQLMAGDRDVIDPKGVIVKRDHIPVTKDFGVAVDDIVGTASNIRLENDRLVADIDLLDDETPPGLRYSIGGHVLSGVDLFEGHLNRDPTAGPYYGKTVLRMDLVAVGQIVPEPEKPAKKARQS